MTSAARAVDVWIDMPVAARVHRRGQTAMLRVVTLRSATQPARRRSTASPP
jgi:hypothetical protein